MVQVLGVRETDAAGECSQAWQSMLGAAAQETLGHAMDRGPVTDFSGGGTFGRQESGIAALRFSPLVVCTSDIDPEPALPFRRRDLGGPEALGVVDGGSAVAEDLGDADLVEGNASDVECGHAAAYDRTQPGRGFGRLGCELGGDTAIAASRGGVGGDVEQAAVDGELVRAGIPRGRDGVACAHQQVTRSVWMARAAHGSGNCPPGVGERQGVVACLGCLERAIGGQPCGGVIIHLDREVGGEDPGFREQGAGFGVISAVRGVPGDQGCGDQFRQGGRQPVIAGGTEIVARLEDSGTQAGQRDRLGMNTVVEHVVK